MINQTTIEDAYISMMYTASDERVEEVGITLPRSLIKQTDNKRITYIRRAMEWLCLIVNQLSVIIVISVNMSQIGVFIPVGRRFYD